MTDFWDEPNIGIATPYRPRRDKIKDRVLDTWLLIQKRLLKRKKIFRDGSKLKILIVGVAVPGREADIREVITKLSRSRHHITTSIVPMADKGKFENIDNAIATASEPLQSFDWLIIADDDISFAEGFLDDLIDLANYTGLSICQPAHRFHSYASFSVTQRKWTSLVRQTRFVEIGPLTAIHKKTFSTLIPFPESRWCWGIDLLWSRLAAQNDWRMGIVDATPISHLRPIAGSYDRSTAIEEGRGLLAKEGLRVTRKEVFGGVKNYYNYASVVAEL